MLGGEKASWRRYPAETITDADYPVDATLLTNTPAKAESQLEQAAEGIGLDMNANKTVYVCV